MEEQTIDPVYKKGFEHGYWLQRADSPELKKHMDDAAKNKPYAQGLKAGSKEATREKVRERLAEADKAQSKDKDKGIEM